MYFSIARIARLYAQYGEYGDTVGAVNLKKIVFVIEELYGGGAERVTAALMNELCPQVEVHLISTYFHDESRDYPTDTRVIKHFFGEQADNRMKKLAKRVAYLRRTVLSIAPDCVVSLAGCGTHALLNMALVGSGIPVVLSERNDPARFPHSSVERMLRFISYICCKGLVFQTYGAQSYFPCIIRKKSVIISNPITSQLPKRYEGIRDNRIVNFCRLSEQKNLDLLMEAFSDIAAEFPDMVLEIYGEGPERERLEQKIVDLRMQNRIYMPGYADNAFEKMRTAAMFVSSSDYEGLSNSMLEAMALGVPSICTDCPAGSAREVISHGENGYLVPVGDRAGLALAMKELLTAPAVMEKFSRNGAKLRDDISAEIIAGKWLAYMERICAK